MVKSRRSFGAAQKAEVVRRHLSGKESVSDLAEELKVQPSQIHLWVKQVLDQAEKAFDRERSGHRLGVAEAKKDHRIEELEQKLARKNEVISELMEANVQAKKSNGGL